MGESDLTLISFIKILTYFVSYSILMSSFLYCVSKVRMRDSINKYTLLQNIKKGSDYLQRI